MQYLDADELLLLPRDRAILIDVRTPSEYTKGHIPGAVNIPLFTDAERAEIGTLYKQSGADDALHRGLEIVGPRMADLLKSVRTAAAGKDVLLYCWRGGKRSASVAWLLNFAGMPVRVLRGGYKAWRTAQRQHFAETQIPFIVLGGKTGSGKTALLRHLAMLGEQVIDLEGLARHKGSAFGAIGEKPQPANEQFENDLYHALMSTEPGRRIWIENESRSIGKVYIPDEIRLQMSIAPLVHIEVPLDQRIDHLVEMYAGMEDITPLQEAFLRIGKRLGGQHVKSALDALCMRDFHTAAAIALRYYDKTYDFGLSQSQAVSIERLEVSADDIDHIARQMISLANSMTSVALT